jgi:hypothetical protein
MNSWWTVKLNFEKSHGHLSKKKDVTTRKMKRLKFSGKNARNEV